MNRKRDDFMFERDLREGASRGFTIVELLIAMAIASIVAMSGFALFSSTNKSYMTQEDVGEVQQNVRIAMDRIAKDIRVAGFGLPESSYSLNFGTGTTFTQPITLVDSTTGPDSITVVGVGYQVGTLAGKHLTGANLCVKFSDDKMKDKLMDAAGNIKSGRKYISIDGHYFTELAAGGAGGECTIGTTKGVEIPLKTTLTRNLDSGTIYVIQAITYSIVNNDASMSPPCTKETPCLKSYDHTELRGTGRVTVAEGIEDIQFAYGIDSNSDKKLDDSNANGIYDSGDFISGAAVNAGGKVRSVAAVRVTVTGKARRTDIRGEKFALPAIENRAAGAADGRRKRFMTKVVKLRNPLKGTANN